MGNYVSSTGNQTNEVKSRNTAAWVSAFAAVTAAIVAAVALYLTNRHKPPVDMGGQIANPSAVVSTSGNGELVDVRAAITLTGFLGQKTILEWSLDYANTGQPVSNTSFVSQVGEYLTPQANTDTAVADFKLPLMSPAGTNFVVHLVLIAPNGSELAAADTPSFTA